MHTSVRKTTVFYLTCVLAAFIIISSLISFAVRPPIIPAVAFKQPVTLVIDPGHGGFDCGAIAVDGTSESSLNLEISQKIYSLAELFGINTVMTRYDDEPLTTREEYSEHNELVRRTEIANAEPSAVLISIHQNTFPTPLPRGLQVYYADNSDSKGLGILLQDNIIAHLDKQNRRIAQPAPEKLYITANAKCPTVLVECGFISNAEDTANLKDHSYQEKFALLVTASFLQYLCGTEV